MSDRFKAFWLGCFILIGIVLAIWLILFLKPIVGDGKGTLKVLFSNVDKITEGTRVIFAGKPVGDVKSIVEIPNIRQAQADAFGNLYIYELTLEVDSSVQVYTYDEIQFATSGLLGEKSIAINPKATPFGAAPAQNVTNEILFARSTDRIEEAINKLTDVAETFENTLESVNSFLQTNSSDFNLALRSFSKVSDGLHGFVSRANETDFAAKASSASDQLTNTLLKTEMLIDAIQEKELIHTIDASFKNIHQITHAIIGGESTIGRLLNSDCTFVQLTTVLCQMEAVLYDIKTYGLLYQFDRRWQRSQQSRCTEIPCEGYCK